MGSKKLGKRIQLAREEAGLNQEHMAAMLGCSQPTLSNYEKGKSRIYLAQLKKVAEVLDRPLNYFLEAMDDADNDDNSRSTSRFITDSGSNQITFNADREVLEIITALFELPEDKRRTIMEFILWEKDRVRRY